MIIKDLDINKIWEEFELVHTFLKLKDERYNCKIFSKYYYKIFLNDFDIVLNEEQIVLVSLKIIEDFGEKNIQLNIASNNIDLSEFALKLKKKLNVRYLLLNSISGVHTDLCIFISREGQIIDILHEMQKEFCM